MQHPQAHTEATILHRASHTGGTAIPQQKEAARTRAWPRAPSTLLSWDGQTTRVSKPLEQPNLYLPFLTLAHVGTQMQRSNLPHGLRSGSPGSPASLQPPSDLRVNSQQGESRLYQGRQQGTLRGADPVQGLGAEDACPRAPNSSASQVDLGPQTLHKLGSACTQVLSAKP